jgi:predicted site-specific integrase-resolvase
MNLGYKIALSTKQTAHVLGISGNSLREWAKRGIVQYQLSDHRHFDRKTLEGPTAFIDRSGKFQSDQSQQEEAKATRQPKGAIYCRVLSRKQKDDLERQVQALQAQYPSYQVYKDIGSGLNYKRKGLARLLKHAQEGLIEEVVVAHRNRLAHFDVDIIEWILQRAGTRLVVLDKAENRQQQKLIKDLPADVHPSKRKNGPPPPLYWAFVGFGLLCFSFKSKPSLSRVKHF